MDLIWLLISTIALSKTRRCAVGLFLRPCMKGLVPLGVFFSRDCDVGVVECGFCYGVEGLLTALVFLDR